MLRQRKKSTKASNFVSRSRSSRRYDSSNSFSSQLLDLIGIRPIVSNPPLSKHQKSVLRFDVIVALVILFVTLATRFYRINIPPSIGHQSTYKIFLFLHPLRFNLTVFDEVHFAAFIDHYVTGRYLFDIHPPLGKLTLTAVAKAFGYKPAQFRFKEIGQPFHDLVYLPQRAFAATAGSFIPPVMYLTARLLSLSFFPSLATAAMPLFDMLLCVESRLILTDSQLILFLQLAYMFAFWLWQTPRSTPRRYVLLFFTAFFAACALSTKWTAFVAPLAIACISLTGLIFPYARLDLLEMLAAAVIAAFIYIGSFWLHFKLLPLSGEGDAFMRNEFQATLPGNKQYNPKAPRIPFLENFWYLNWEMLRANSAIETRHPWESKWYEWLYNARGVLYSDENFSRGRIERIYIVVNPVLTVITAIGVISAVIFIISKIAILVQKAVQSENDSLSETSHTSSLSSSRRNTKASNRLSRKQTKKLDGSALRVGKVVDDEEDTAIDDDGNDDTNKTLVKAQNIDSLLTPPEPTVLRYIGILLLLFVVWGANLLPYIGVKRCTFLYHVLPALQISSLITGVMLNCVPRTGRLRSIVSILVIIALGGAYYRWRPWVYALPRTEKELVALRLLPRWD